MKNFSGFSGVSQHIPHTHFFPCKVSQSLENTVKGSQIWALCFPVIHGINRVHADTRALSKGVTSNTSSVKDGFQGPLNHTYRVTAYHASSYTPYVAPKQHMGYSLYMDYKGRLIELPIAGEWMASKVVNL